MLNVFQWSEPQIFTFFFLLARVTALVAFLPLLGDRTIPPTVKILMGLAFSVVVFPVAWDGGVRVPGSVVDSAGRMLWALCSDVGFGMLVGFVARWIFDAAQVAGYIAGTTLGFSIASIFDPHTETQTISVSEMYYLLAALLFLGMDGHHVYLKSIVESLKTVPLGGADLLANGDSVVRYLIQMTGEVLALGAKLAAPVVVVVLLVNLTFGLMSRAVPQMNVITVTFTANIIVGLFLVLLSMPGFLNMVGGAFDSYSPELTRFMGLFRG